MVNKETPSSGMLTVPEVAEQLRVKPQTAYRWVREGSLRPSVSPARSVSRRRCSSTASNGAQSRGRHDRPSEGGTHARNTQKPAAADLAEARATGEPSAAAAEAAEAEMSRTTHRGSCSRCNTTSPRFSTSGEADRWVREHRGTCTRTAKPAVNMADVDELLTRARAHKRIDAKPVEPEAPCRVRYWQGGGSMWALRETVLPAPVERDRWGRPLR